MGDIAGCRVLVYSEDALSKLILKFNSIFNIKYFNDYTVESKDDGYRGYHFYIESPINPNKLIEIQLRTVTSHKWASMVEIVDILYDLKIKEGQKHPDFEKFLLLFSNKNNLSNSEKKELLKIDDKFKVYNKLNEVFVKNHIQIRMDWLKISNQNNNYFIIEVDAEKTSKIYSFNTYEKAEENYFNKFKENNNSNFVLTHIEKPNFKRLCIAYASYVLIKHDYLNDWNEFTSDVLKESIDKNNKIDLHFFKNYTKRNLDDQMALIKSELDEAKKYKETSEIDTKGFEEWVNEIKENLEKVTNLAMKRANANGKSKKGFIQKLLGI
jgi:ppGpp synthetase/RelA/SpoT-type nucleotidyltranferase